MAPVPLSEEWVIPIEHIETNELGEGGKEVALRIRGRNDRGYHEGLRLSECLLRNHNTAVDGSSQRREGGPISLRRSLIAVPSSSRVQTKREAVEVGRGRLGSNPCLG